MAATVTSAPRDAAARTPVRTDIQGLRAVAVSIVLLYHLWPEWLPGGFTGVDVFFVISGFLITSHLLAHPPRTGRDLLNFWSRRVRRLLPAALLVLLATLVASRLLAPDTQWANTAGQARAAALYVVNWRLAADSVDYLAAAAAPSPVQHFWSLSVEEQFYVIWPVLILLLVASAGRWRRPPLRVTGLGLTLLVAASVAYSIYDTNADPSAAYFVTPTRIWELGVGGLLAVVLSRRALGGRRDSDAVPWPLPVRVLLAWAGLAAIAWAVFTYSGSTPFPGYRAALPVLGAAAVIAAHLPTGFGSPGPRSALRPVQWLGNVSYSLYLWHWPLIVLVPYASGGRLGNSDKIVIIVVSLALAGLTKRFVEDRFRTGGWGRPLLKPFALAAAGMAVVVVAASLQLTEVEHRENQAEAALARSLAGGDPCFGAAALAEGPSRCPRATSGALTPTPLQAARDKSDAYAAVSGSKDCFAYLPNFPVTVCRRGDPTATTDVALVGNSHAGEWVPALEAIAKQRHWRLTLYLASECSNADVLQSVGTGAQDQACREWGRRVTQRVVHGGYNLVVMADRISVNAVGEDLNGSQQPYARGYRTVLTAFRRAHLHVVGLRDTPAPGTSVPDCLAAHADDYSTCDGTRARWLPREPLSTAIAEVGDPNITEADLTDRICEPVVCPAAVGKVPVYFDGSHLTATYSRTLAPYLAPILLRAVT